MLVIPFGIVMDVSEEQSSKAFFPILVKLSGRVIDVRAEQK